MSDDRPCVPRARKRAARLVSIETRPEGYPEELLGELRLDDGRRVGIRPILPRDAEPLRRAIADADAETLRLRFLGWKPVLDDSTLRHLVEVDYRWRLALVATDDHEHGVAVGRYEGAPGRDDVEIAIAVDPGWRRVGLATRLLALLALAAAARGIDRITAYYLAENTEVGHLVNASWLPQCTSVSMGVAEVEIDIRTLRTDAPGNPFTVAEEFAASRQKRSPP